MRTVVKTSIWAVFGLVALAALVFGPAGSLHYWQAWVLLAVFTFTTWLPTIYLLRTDPAVLERRMRAGPAAETRPVQRIAIVVATASLVSLILVSALDHRFGWSVVPDAVSVFGDVLVAVGVVTAMSVVIENSYAAATITVEPGQTVVCTGFYRLVRHPMYVGVLVTLTGTPLALGSYWGLALLLPEVLALVVRIRDEERLLAEELSGYRDYQRQVRYRLVPHLW